LPSRSLKHLFGLPRWIKASIVVSADFTLLMLAMLLAMNLRLDHWRFVSDQGLLLQIAGVSALTIALLFVQGVYRSLIRFLTFSIVPRLLVGLMVSALLHLLSSAAFNVFVPRSVPLVYALVGFALLAGPRYLLRWLYLHGQAKGKPTVVIYGAGASGRQLAASLARGSEFKPVGFIDDNPALKGKVVEGLKIYLASHLPALVNDRGISAVLLALPSISALRRREILTVLEKLPVRVQTIPRITDIVSGRAKVSDIRHVSIEELLGREPVEPDPSLLGASITGKSVLVTGAGGSIGSELCRQILRQSPRQLVLLELSEYALYQIEQELAGLSDESGAAVPVIPLLGSVLNRDKLRAAIRAYGIETIYHAAAYKHVPLVEQNVAEGLRNNIFGTLAAAETARETGVESFILISTDKAVRPTNFMGANKRVAELICQALAAAPGRTRFSMVRFGNVLGSSGSVVPLFQKQIEQGGPVTVTHREITRYFMTITEAAQLVIQAAATAEGGDVFVLDMGEPVRIADLAARMIKLCGFHPVIAPGVKTSPEDIELTFSGLRPGEKLYEELLLTDDAMSTGHPRISRAKEESLPLRTLMDKLSALESALDLGDVPAIHRLLAAMPLKFQHDGRFTDLMAPAVSERKLAAE
jgi:FlaA1/EpsC-like NDP-sugar epimerase